MVVVVKCRHDEMAYLEQHVAPLVNHHFFFHIRNIACIKRFLSAESTRALVLLVHQCFYYVSAGWTIVTHCYMH